MMLKFCGQGGIVFVVGRWFVPEEEGFVVVFGESKSLCFVDDIPFLVVCDEDGCKLPPFG